jgi:hypothetical protein
MRTEVENQKHKVTLFIEDPNILRGPRSLPISSTLKLKNLLGDLQTPNATSVSSLDELWIICVRSGPVQTITVMILAR